MAYIICNECKQAADPSTYYCPNCGAPLIKPTNSDHDSSKTAFNESSALMVCAVFTAFLFPPISVMLSIIGIKKYSQELNRLVCTISLIVAIVNLIAIALLLIYVVPNIIHTYDTANKTTDKLDKVLRYLPV